MTKLLEKYRIWKQRRWVMERLRKYQYHLFLRKMIKCGGW